MNSKNRLFNISSAIVFAVAFFVYYLSAERTGSLWDCGEFILGAYKLQVVHPPGAPLFMIVGRIFSLLGDVLSSNPSTIAFAVNIMSGMFSAITAALVAHSTMLLSDIIVKNKNEQADFSPYISSAAGIAAGLAAAFCSSIWFSAVEGEVYSMSTFFTALTAWSAIKWYSLPKDRKHDKWLIFSAYSAGLSLGVHLLSLLTFPAIALFIYFKKSKKKTWTGAIGSIAAGAIAIPFIQKLVIVGIPQLWLAFDIFMVNSLGLPFHSGIIPTFLAVGAIFYFAFRYAARKNHHLMQLGILSTLMICIGFSTIGVIVIRANADTPVNMNVPSDASRLLPYINREQYGERQLAFGPHYEASPTDYKRSKRYGRVYFPPSYGQASDSKYSYVDEKITPIYSGKDKMLFPRVSHTEMGRPNIYRNWYNRMFNGDPKPSFLFNMAFFMKYQVNWMYTRYFMWNFVGRQNGSQGYYPWDKSDGNWKSGVKIIDEMKLYNLDQEPETMKNNKANNNYYFLPLIFGLIGFFYHFRNSPFEFSALFILFLITGLGIILYSNQPPNEPRERDYVLVGSFFTFCMWIGLAIPALYKMLSNRIKLAKIPMLGIASAIVLTAPALMGFQNFDDHSRSNHFASRDYAKNFLNSVEPNAVIFTYGDNDTYPLWYVQEVENVRRDVRIVNLSLIAVDWYINKLTRKVNDSPPLKLTVSPEAYRGNSRNQLLFYSGGQPERPMDIYSWLKFAGGRNPISGGSMQFESYLPSHDIYIPTNFNSVQSLGMVDPKDSLRIENQINIKFAENKTWITKDDLAVLDVIASNMWERPVYFATTCKNEKLLGLNDYMQFEGLALRIVPVKTNSDKSLSIYGSGRVNTTNAYNNIINKFEWGNFDKEDVFVNNSYAAAVQAHRMIMMRTAEQLLAEGESQKAVDIVDKYFEAFPHFNFPYDASVLPFLNLYVRMGQNEKAKTHLRILAAESADHMDFYESIDPDILQSSFNTDFSYCQRAIQSSLGLADNMKDEEFKKEMNDLLGSYLATSVPN